MGLQDREYNRSGGGGNALARLFMGDFTLGHFAGIRVRVHASLLFLIGFRLLFAGMTGWRDALAGSAVLFGIVLLHEFGHCFAARAVGGRGDDVLLWPLGGLAFIGTPRRPWPSFVGTAGGPLTNVLICIVSALALRVIEGTWVAGNPMAPLLVGATGGAWVGMSSTAAYYLAWIYSTSLMLLLFNLLPIFPLDGGQMFQAILWPKLGFYNATNVACIVGMVLAGAIFVFSLGNLFLMFLMFSCGFYCYQMRLNLRNLADEVWEEERYSGAGSWGDAPARPRRMPKLRVMRGGAGANSKPLDDRLTLRDLSPMRWWKRRRERKQFEKLIGDD